MLDLLQALENKHFISVEPKRRNIAFPEEPLTKEELIYEMELAVNSKKNTRLRKLKEFYNYEQRKYIINFLRNVS